MLYAWTKKNRGFTLVELLIVVAIIWVIASSARFLNFEEINNRKKVELFTATVARWIENIRNNALYGRSLLAENPEAWRISINLNNSGTVTTEYLSGSTWNIYDDQDSNYTVDFPEYISSISCDTSLDVSSGTGIILYTGSELSLSGSCSINDKYMTIETWYGSYTWSLNINSISGVIETSY